MAMMYPWATKEYLLWNMTIGQIILYHNLGMQRLNGDADQHKEKKSLVNLDVDELRKMRDEHRAMVEQQQVPREELARRYGDIGDGR